MPSTSAELSSGWLVAELERSRERRAIMDAAWREIVAKQRNLKITGI